MKKLFVKENLIIWSDPNVYSQENHQYADTLREICELKLFTDWQQAANLAQSTEFNCNIITSDINGEELTKRVTNKVHVNSIFVLRSNTTFLSNG